MRRELERQQNEILGVLDRLEALIGDCGENQIVSLGETRIAFGELLHQHSVFKEQIYAALREAGGERVDRIVGRSRSRMMGLIVAYRFHGADWSPRAMLADWTAYLEASQALIARIRHQIAEDRHLLYPLLDEYRHNWGGIAPTPASAFLSVHRALGNALEPQVG